MVRNKVRVFRQDKWNLSQSELSDRLPSKPGKTLLSLIENGHALPTPELMDELCRFFSCKPYELFNEADMTFGAAKGEEDDTVIRIDSTKEVLDAIAEMGYVGPEEWYFEMERNLLRERDIRRVSKMLMKDQSSIHQSSDPK